MTFKEWTTYNNRAVDSIDAIKQRNGQGSWREPLAASPELRSVLIQFLPGEAVKAHQHTLAGEVFLIVEGKAEVEIGEGPPELAGPGTILYASRGQRHAFRVTGPEPMILLCFLASNSPRDSVQTSE